MTAPSPLTVKELLLDYLRMKNWDKWQSYRKDRGQPPWIKIHRILLRNNEWHMLSDAQKGHLASMWMLAADRNGEIPADPEIIKKFCMLDEIPDLQLFISLDFIEHDASVTPAWRQGDAKVTPQSRIGQSRSEERRQYPPPTGAALSLGKKVNKTKEENKIIKANADIILDYLIERTGRRFSNTNEIIKCLKRDKPSVDDCRMMIDFKWNEWKGTKFEGRIDPVTPFLASRFPGYLDSAKAVKRPAPENTGPVDDWGNKIPDWELKMEADMKKSAESEKVDKIEKR